jgi:amino acid transporter
MDNLDAVQRTTILRRSADAAPTRTWRHLVFGRPLSSREAEHQTIGKIVGLAVFSSDALSSTAYATQEIMSILAFAGAAAFAYTFSISLAIATLLLIVTISYQQTIHAYPGGGGAYIVARDNLGEAPAQTAGAALLTDYILTVSVSIASGVAQIVSAYPALFPYRVVISVALVLGMMVVNLRGVKESGTIFAFPTYYFIVMIFITIGFAFWRYAHGTLGTVVNPPPWPEGFGTLTVVTPFLLLHAFASGTAALTGVEAISNGITAFKEPRSHNAGITLLWMSAILGSAFVAISWLVKPMGCVPSEIETVISQVARTAFGGRNTLYYMAIWATTVILIMGANTAYADFPRLGALHAGDGFLPRQLTAKGSRLVFSKGIVTLAIVASALIIAFHASVDKLIPLYAIGVFLSFTLSQAGMARRWWRCGHLKPGQEVVDPGSVLRYERGWQLKMCVNGFGSMCTCIVMVIFAATKFRDGAWVVIILTPTLVIGFFRIHHHYREMAAKLSLDGVRGGVGRITRHRVIVPVSGVHRGALAALNYARLLSPDVTAVHVSTDEADAQRVKDKWDVHGAGVRLVILNSPYRLILEPIIEYIEELCANRQPDEMITVVVPDFVPEKWWHRALHTQAALVLRRHLLSTPGVVVTDVPYHLASAVAAAMPEHGHH